MARLRTKTGKLLKPNWGRYPRIMAAALYYARKKKRNAVTEPIETLSLYKIDNKGKIVVDGWVDDRLTDIMVTDYQGASQVIPAGVIAIENTRVINNAGKIDYFAVDDLGNRLSGPFNIICTTECDVNQNFAAEKFSVNEGTLVLSWIPLSDASQPTNHQQIFDIGKGSAEILSLLNSGIGEFVASDGVNFSRIVESYLANDELVLAIRWNKINNTLNLGVKHNDVWLWDVNRKFDGFIPGLVLRLMRGDEFDAKIKSLNIYDKMQTQEWIESPLLETGNYVYQGSGSGGYDKGSYVVYNVGDTLVEKRQLKISAELFIKALDTGAYRGIIGMGDFQSNASGNEFGLYINVDDALSLFITNSNGTKSVFELTKPIVTGQWIKVIGEYDPVKSIVRVAAEDMNGNTLQEHIWASGGGFAVTSGSVNIYALGSRTRSYVGANIQARNLFVEVNGVILIDAKCNESPDQKYPWGIRSINNGLAADGVIHEVGTKIEAEPLKNPVVTCE